MGRRGGYQPEWYQLIRAARVLGCSVFELMEQPAWWANVGMIVDKIEGEIENKRRAAAAKYS